MAVYETSPEQQLVDSVPAAEGAIPEEDDANTANSDTPRKKTRRSRRGGYRRKRQQQKKVQALMAASAAERAAKAASEACDGASTATTEEENSSCESSGGTESPQRACVRKKNPACDSTATTEEESSSCESSGGESPQTVCEKNPVTMAKTSEARIQRQQQQQLLQMHQHKMQQLHQHKMQQRRMHEQQMHQQQMHQQQYYNSYYQGPMHPTAQIDPAYCNYGLPMAPARKRNAVKKPYRNNIMTKEQNEDRYLALDCEMVGVGPNGAHSCLARVTLIDWHGNVVMDEMVKPQWEISDYRTFVSGVTKEMLDQATMDFGTARAQVLRHLQGKILVGHALKNDLHVLGITHPWHMIRDTAQYEPYMKDRFQDGFLWPRGLKDLCKEKLNRDIQVYGRPHCPKEDALAALDLYRLVWRKFERSMAVKVRKSRAMHRQYPVPTM